MSSWAELAAEMRKPLKGSGSDVTRARRGITEFADWATRTNVEFPVSVEREPEVLTAFGPELDVYAGAKGGLNRDGQACIEWAKKLMKRSRELAVEGGAELETEPEVSHEENLKNLEAERMARREQDEVELDGDGDELDMDESDESYEDDEPQAPPARPRGPRAPPQPRIVVQMPKAPPSQRARASREDRGTAGFRSKIPRTQVIAIFKRDESGRKQHIDDYTNDEIGEMHLPSFIEEFIDPKHGNEPDENGWADTMYLVQERDPATGALKGQSAPIRVRVNVGTESAPKANPLIESLRTVREAKEVLENFERPDPRADLFRSAAESAGAKGDFSQMMMLAMMERLFAKSSDSGNDKLLMAVLDELRQSRGLAPLSGGSGAIAPMPPPMMYPPMPPMPPPPAAPPSAIDKLMELSLAKLAAPGPTFSDQMKDMMTFQQLIGASRSNDGAVIQAIQQLQKSIEANNGGAKPGSLEDTVSAFEKVQTLVKTLAPEVGAGSGLSGFIKGILTPEVGKMIATTVAGAEKAPPQVQSNGMTGVPGAPASQVQASQAPAPQAQQPAPRDPSKPPNPMPPGITEALKGFRMAQTRPTQVERFVDLVMAMFMSQDPFFVNMLQPALENLNQADKGPEFLKVPRITGMRLLIDARAELATPEFVDAVLGAMAARAGASIPASLTSTTGKWTLDYTGANVIMLESLGAKAAPDIAPTAPNVAVVEAPAPQVQVAIAPPPQYAELIENARKAEEQQRAAESSQALAASASEVLMTPAVPAPA